MVRYVEMQRGVFKLMLLEILGTLREKSSLDAYEDWELSDMKAWLDETSLVIRAYLEDRRRQEALGAWMEK